MGPPSRNRLKDIYEVKQQNVINKNLSWFFFTIQTGEVYHVSSFTPAGCGVNPFFLINQAVGWQIRGHEVSKPEEIEATRMETKNVSTKIYGHTHMYQ